MQLMEKTEIAGLTSSSVEALHLQFGYNEIRRAQRINVILQFASFFTNPLVVILLVASAISAFVGEATNSLIIATIVLFSVILDFTQSRRAQHAEELLKSKVSQTASVKRDGHWTEVPVRSIVPGDFVRLCAGDLVPADARIIKAIDLHVNEAALTGESFPVEKLVEDETNHDDDRAKVFMGSSIVSGTATALVFATGSRTQFGAIASQLSAKSPETEFERGTRKFGMLICKTVFILVLFVLTTNLCFGRDPIQSLLFALALAVGLTPEFLPMIMTVTLGQSALRMAEKKVIVKHLSAIQNFGSIDVLCSDKTGTLTSGELTLRIFCDPSGEKSQEVLRMAYLNSFYETGIKNSLDEAILNYETLDVSSTEKLDEIPFDFERRRLSVVVKDSENILISKGAPEAVLNCCTQVMIAGRLQNLDHETLTKVDDRWRDLSRQGFRVIAVAFKTVSSQKTLWSKADETELTLAGYLAFEDPILSDTAETISALRRDGIKVKILTGDNELVTAHVCSQVGISTKRIIQGKDIDRLTQPALAQLAEKHSVFVRVTPAQKYRIILALKARGHVVGFLGDGINDAPSLHASDVGISVANATAVAKESAEIILMERNLQILHEGIREGRKAFGNVVKYLLMGTSSNFGNMFSMAGASVALPFLPMLPTQILLNNFLYDLAQVTIPTDRIDESYARKPHRWNVEGIRNFMLTIGPISSLYDFLTFYVLLNVFRADEKLFHTGWFIESLATQTLVIFVIRTTGNPLKSRPSAPLVVSTIMVVLIGIILPFSPLASMLGFCQLPSTFYAFLFFATTTYLLIVNFAKHKLLMKI